MRCSPKCCSASTSGKLLANRVLETATTAHFADSYSDGAYLLLHSDRRTDGWLLHALLVDQPKSDLIPKLVRGLLARRVEGRWANTQENALILVALERYLRTYERETPRFTVRTWLGDRFAGTFTFAGRTNDSYTLAVPMRALTGVAAPQDITLAKEGPGKLYYRVGLDYAPASVKLKALERGFSLSRTYEGVDDPGDVVPTAKGSWLVKAGARVRVKIRLIAGERRYHLALVDPLPAGLEPLPPELTGTQPVPDRARTALSQSNWFEHQNLRDSRAEVFDSVLDAGVYEYSYLARATTPGDFIVPPPKAEQMYEPEVFGRGSTDRVVIR